MRIPLRIVVFVLAAVVLHSTSARPQSVDQSENQFLYNEALRASLVAMNREWGKLNLTNRGTRAPIDFHNMIVRKEAGITDGLHSQFDEYRVTYLESPALIGRWKGLRKRFAILGVRPVECPEGRLKIAVDLLWVNYQRAQLQFEIDSWADVYFRYDAANRKYVVDDVELGGV